MTMPIAKKPNVFHATTINADSVNLNKESVTPGPGRAQTRRELGADYGTNSIWKQLHDRQGFPVCFHRLSLQGVGSISTIRTVFGAASWTRNRWFHIYWLATASQRLILTLVDH